MSRSPSPPDDIDDIPAGLRNSPDYEVIRRLGAAVWGWCTWCGIAS
ncbi:MAG: hypothetical protein NT069_18975 [Planctomycetota bacterium]|nr:hypothetical protein [Planctomycetota bacterium]